MTAAPSAAPPDRLSGGEDGLDRRLLTAAMVVALVGAALRAVGGVVPAVDGAEPGFTSAPLLVALALAPVLLAGVVAARSRFAPAAAVLVGAAVLAPGAAVVDLQLVVDPSVASRPELYLPVDLAAPAPSVGLWALLAGHVAVVVAGVLAFGVLRGGEPGVVGGFGTDGAEGADGVLAGWRRRSVLLALAVAVVGACGLVMTPFSSDDVYLLAQNAFEGPTVALVGHVVCALALPVGAVLLVAEFRDASVARGGLAGLASALAAMSVPALVAAVAMPSLHVGAGSVLAGIGVLGLGVVAFLGRADGRAATDTEPARMPGRRGLEVSTGAVAVATGALAVVGALLPQVEVGGGVGGAAEAPQSPARFLLLAAGVVLAVPGAALFVARPAPVVRPVVSMVWVGVPLAAAAVLDTALTTGYTSSLLSGAGPAGTGFGDRLTAASIGSGPGVLWAWLAMVGAAVTACCSVVAGVVEREDVDEDVDEDEVGDEPGLSAVALRMLTPLTAAAVLVIAAFVTPMVTAVGYVEPGLVSDVGPPTWGLAAALVTVVGGCVLVTRSRPERAAAVLVGAAGVMGLRAATVPLVGGEIDGSSAGLGLWFSLGAVVVLLGCAAIAVLGRRRP
ncbi:hypothetical protein [Saccharomonospora azurea]|uniref:Uncharacterized protein n=1 Tax=Saccharomonospora azurea NA-128 TaxID=882081 RepID=H8G4W3_9PSEU|nr:hypothetical protein [Saccharomonospora azurea]EHY90180.1 hypothetical protein SacazDRAFT_03303 [Saccharomonospora azurea NA-128]